jgi:hypothetical protein
MPLTRIGGVRYETVFGGTMWLLYFMTGILTNYAVWWATALYEAFTLKEWATFDPPTKAHHILTNLGTPVVVWILSQPLATPSYATASSALGASASDAGDASNSGGVAALQPGWFAAWAAAQSMMGMSNLWLCLWQSEGIEAGWVKLAYAFFFFYGRLYCALWVHVEVLRTHVFAPWTSWHGGDVDATGRQTAAPLVSATPGSGDAGWAGAGVAGVAGSVGSVGSVGSAAEGGSMSLLVVLVLFLMSMFHVLNLFWAAMITRAIGRAIFVGRPDLKAADADSADGADSDENHRVGSAAGGLGGGPGGGATVGTDNTSLKRGTVLQTV